MATIKKASQPASQNYPMKCATLNAIHHTSVKRQCKKQWYKVSGDIERETLKGETTTSK